MSSLFGSCSGKDLTYPSMEEYFQLFIEGEHGMVTRVGDGKNNTLYWNCR